MATDLTDLTGSVYVTAAVTATGDPNLPESSVKDTLNWGQVDAVAFGADYDQMWHDKRTIAAAATDNIDLQAETNSLGHTCVFTSVQNVLIKNATDPDEVAMYFVATLDSPDATWSVSDVVKDGDTGAIWTGTIFKVIDTSNFVILLDAGFAYADVDVADLIDNDTAPSTGDSYSKAVQAGPQLKIGVAAANPADLWLGTTEYEWLDTDKYSLHNGDWTIAAGAKVLKVENLSTVLPASLEIIVLGSEA
jgi:hypothetical protein